MIVFDLETDGLLHDVTKIHCMVCYNTEDDTTTIYNDEGDQHPIIRGITYLEGAVCIVGLILLVMTSLLYASCIHSLKRLKQSIH